MRTPGDDIVIPLRLRRANLARLVDEGVRTDWALLVDDGEGTYSLVVNDRDLPEPAGYYKRSDSE